MGLDIVEFVIAVEATSGIDIADADAERLRTPCDVITHLRGRLPIAEGNSCLTQQAFYRTRRALIVRFGRRRHALRSATACRCGPGSRAR